jgi:hypothetical protein
MILTRHDGGETAFKNRIEDALVICRYKNMIKYFTGLLAYADYHGLAAQHSQWFSRETR